jgi:hypothetical protein
MGRSLVQVMVSPGKAEAILHDRHHRAFSTAGRWRFDVAPRAAIVGSVFYRDSTDLDSKSGAVGGAFGFAPTSRVSIWTEVDADLQTTALGGHSWIVKGAQIPGFAPVRTDGMLSAGSCVEIRRSSGDAGGRACGPDIRAESFQSAVRRMDARAGTCGTVLISFTREWSWQIDEPEREPEGMMDNSYDHHAGFIFAGSPHLVPIH